MSADRAPSTAADISIVLRKLGQRTRNALSGASSISFAAVRNWIHARIGKITGHPNQQLVKLPAGPLLLAGDLCERLCRPLGISPPIYRRRIEFFVNNRAYDTTKAATRLGFRSQVPLDDGLARTAAWYREQGLIAS